jgi:23S rRNA (uracil1939-C5)-methyltransferase
VRKRKKHPIIYNLEITNLAAEGKAIAKIDEKIVFVTKVIPGDIVDVQVNRKRKSFLEGYPIKFHKYSENRVPAICKHFGVCGGCKWQNLPYNLQLSYKHNQVVDNFERIGKLKVDEIKPILASENTDFYRNKLEYTFTNRRWLHEDEIENAEEKILDGLGFHVPGRFDKVLDIEFCHLQPAPSNEIRLAVREFALKYGMSFFDLRKQEGLLRNLIIRNNSSGEFMVIASFFYEDEKLRNSLLEYLHQQFPKIKSLMYVVNPKRNDTISDLEIKHFAGDSFIFEKMEDLKFKISPKSFFQTNSLQAYNLYKIVREFANLNGDEVVYDLYTGTGTIANFIAKSAKKVIGIEFIEDAIADAKTNSAINNLSNTSFFAGDIKDILNEEFILENGKPDVIILDPPRAGIHKNVVESLLYAKPEKIVYVSCNPATQARDIALLGEEYQVKLIQPVDMFPHTHHVENVALLHRIS